MSSPDLEELASQIKLTPEQIKDLQKVCSGKFTFVIVGPSQHGKTTFVTNIIGVDPNEIDEDKYAIGKGTGSITQDLHIWHQKAKSADVEVQFIDSPGLYDSRAEVSNDSIKEKILSFLNTNKPDCVMLFCKFFQEITGVFMEAVKFAKDIATLHKCPILFVHTYCDASISLNSYPNKFVEDCDSDEDNDEKQLLIKCFLEWKETREDKIKKELGDEIKFYSCCYGVMPRGNKKKVAPKLILPDGTRSVENVLITLENVIGQSLLIICAEYAKDEEARRISGEKIKTVVMGILTAAAATVAVIAVGSFVALPVAVLVGVGGYLLRRSSSSSALPTQQTAPSTQQQTSSTM